jgi:HEAT repeat protein
MSNGEFAQLFQTCITRENREYVVARDAILAMGAAVRPQIDVKLDAVDWQEQMVAQILAAWLDNRILFGQVMSIVNGSSSEYMLVSSISGTWPPADRAGGLRALGSVVVPRLLEILLKSKETSEVAGIQAILQALNGLRDARAVMPLANLVGKQVVEPARILALGVLGTFKDARTFETVRSALANLDNSAGVRSAAAVALGLFEDRRATPALLAALRDPTENDAVRRQAARGLGYLRDPAASNALAGMLRSEQPPEMALTLVQALGKLGGSIAVAALEEAGRSHSDEGIRHAAEGARRMLA